MKVLPVLVLTAGALLCATAEIQTINGKQYECSDGLCRLVEPPAPNAAPSARQSAPDSAFRPPRLAQGYLSPADLIAFVENKPSVSGTSDLWQRAGGSMIVLLLLALLGGLVMNLTPCVLPMVPVTLMVIGKSARRGTAYGAGLTLAYGTLGVAASLGGLAFGSIQGNPWFNLAVSIVFALLGLALLGVFFIDFSRWRRLAPRLRPNASASAGLLFAFLMGALSAVLAGACVAPVLIAVLMLTARLYAEGSSIALLLPFALGLGMALPWPFVGAGLSVLPKPGNWMKGVNRAFALIVFGLAIHYGLLAARGFGPSRPPSDGTTPATFTERLSQAKRPVFVDCWATWCKNCAAMEKVLERPDVQKALKDHSVIRLQAEDMTELRQLKGFENVKGLPAFLIFD